MNYGVPHGSPAYNAYCTTGSAATAPHTRWHDHGYLLPPIYGQPHQPYTLLWSHSGGSRVPPGHVEYHHYYGLNPLFFSNPNWYYRRQYTQPPANPAVSVGRGLIRRQPCGDGAWPEGTTLRGELRWGKLQRVYGPRREVPDFVREDLRRVYGTYPRTDVGITYQGGEYVVRGDPWVGDQEYRVEKKVVRQLESPEGDSVSEIVERRKKKTKKK